MATFSAQGLMEFLVILGFDVKITNKREYIATHQNYKEISFKEYWGKVDTIRVLKNTYSDIDCALEYAQNGEGKDE